MLISQSFCFESFSADGAFKSRPALSAELLMRQAVVLEFKFLIANAAGKLLVAVVDLFLLVLF